MCEQNVEMVLMAVFILEEGRLNIPRSLWKYERVGGYVEHNLWTSFLENIFKKHMRVNIPTLNYLCTILGYVLGNFHINIYFHTY